MVDAPRYGNGAKVYGDGLPPRGVNTGAPQMYQHQNMKEIDVGGVILPNLIKQGDAGIFVTQA